SLFPVPSEQRMMFFAIATCEALGRGNARKPCAADSATTPASVSKRYDRAGAPAPRLHGPHVPTAAHPGKPAIRVQSRAQLRRRAQRVCELAAAAGSAVTGAR